MKKKYWKKVSWNLINKNKTKRSFYESNLLKLNCNKARINLKCKCILSFDETINMVAKWYKIYYSKTNKIYETSFSQIREYEKLIKKRLIK